MQGDYVVLASEPHCLCGVDVCGPQQRAAQRAATPAERAQAGGGDGAEAAAEARALTQRLLATFHKQLSPFEVLHAL